MALEVKQEVKLNEAEQPAQPVSPKSTAADSAMLHFEEAVLPEVDSTGIEPFKESVLKALQEVLDRFGSVTNFLQQHHGSPREMQQLANSLHHLCQEGWTEWKVDAAALTACSPELRDAPSIQLPLAAFGFGPMCSVRSVPDNHTVLEIAESILNDGFMSTNQPVMAMQSADILQSANIAGVHPPWTGKLLPFSVGFSKGRTRIHALLAIATIVFDNGIDLKKAWNGQETVSSCFACLFMLVVMVSRTHFLNRHFTNLGRFIPSWPSR